MESMFIKDPTIKILRNTDGWLLATEGEVLLIGGAIQGIVVIPEGFYTNFANVPLLFRGVIRVNGKHRFAALLHDYMYSVRGNVVTKQGIRVNFSRKECDLIFLKEMGFSKVNFIKRKIMYRIVRLFGGKSW